MHASPLQAEYGTPVDRESAYEKLLAKVAPRRGGGEDAAAAESRAKECTRARSPRASAAPSQAVLGSSVFKSFMRSAASAAGREISRSIFGTSKKTRRR